MRTNNKWRVAAARAVSILLTAAAALTLAAGVSAADIGDDGLCVGGMPFGVRFKTEGLTVAGLGDVETKDGAVCPAKDAGLLPRDVIITVDGEPVDGSDELVDIISKSGGKAVEIVFERGGKRMTATLTPAPDKNGVPRAGMWVRDSAAGIGTVTFYDENSGFFAGLGHGICDADTGELIPLSSGRVTDVRILGIEKGEAGTPGELKGCFGTNDTGSVDKNTETGVYGTFEKIPNGGEHADIASRDEVRSGDVVIRCTLADGDTHDYSAVISDINRSSRDNKSFIITVTDEELIARTGGIVQGMSGSPILQNGKLIGAVTHVMINDPTRGFGIFIENMIDGASSHGAR